MAHILGSQNTFLPAHTWDFITQHARGNSLILAWMAANYNVDIRETENWIKGEEAAFVCSTGFSMSVLMDVTGCGGTLWMTHTDSCKPESRLWNLPTPRSGQILTFWICQLCNKLLLLSDVREDLICAWKAWNIFKCTHAACSLQKRSYCEYQNK